MNVLVSESEIAEREIKGNAAKFWLYRETCGQIKEAQEQAFTWKQQQFQRSTSFAARNFL